MLVLLLRISDAAKQSTKSACEEDIIATEKESSRRTDVDVDCTVRSLLKMNEELCLENARKKRISFFGTSAVQSEPIISKVRQTNTSNSNKRDPAFESCLSATLYCLRDEDVDGFVGLWVHQQGTQYSRTSSASMIITHKDEITRTGFRRSSKFRNEKLSASRESDSFVRCESRKKRESH